MQLGVDEAGKGPVLGPMVAAAVRADPDDLPDGVDDSKALDAERRERLAAAIREAAAVTVVRVPVERIDAEETDMNGLTVDAHAEALAALAREGDQGYLDAADPNAVRFERRVTERVPVEADLRAEHAADESYPIVSAASILAKVERDAAIAEIADEHGDVGSGYPSDPTTRAFLREYVAAHDELPSCARASWQTSADVLAAAEQSSLSDF